MSKCLWYKNISKSLRKIFRNKFELIKEYTVRSDNAAFEHKMHMQIKISIFCEKFLFFGIVDMQPACVCQTNI